MIVFVLEVLGIWVLLATLTIAGLNLVVRRPWRR